MVRLILGAIMILLFLFVSLVRLAAPNKNDAEFILPMAWFLVLPGLVLVFLGWRARRQTPLKPTWLNVLMSLVCIAVPFSPIIYYAGPQMATEISEESEDHKQLESIGRPLVEAQISPNEFEPRILKYVEDGGHLVRKMRRQKLAVEYLIERSIPETEPTIIKIFESYGSKDMAEMLINSGNAQLEAAARSWARQYGYTIETTTDQGYAKWRK